MPAPSIIRISAPGILLAIRKLFGGGISTFVGTIISQGPLIRPTVSPATWHNGTTGAGLTATSPSTRAPAPVSERTLPGREGERPCVIG
ncbi:MAG: hypothetical protein JW999_08630 [Methanotrichaceae archaeon]|nr:hypothetical protein [Methanotrichaceae archaeon]